MNISGKVFPVVQIDVERVPEIGKQIRLIGNTIQVLVGDDSGTRWVNASTLKKEREAWKSIFETVTWRLGSAAEKCGLSKAEVKRRLISAGVISK
jgi:hypothetical protein